MPLNFGIELIILYPHHVAGIEESEKEDEKQEEEKDEEEVGVEAAVHPACLQPERPQLQKIKASSLLLSVGADSHSSKVGT